MNISLQSNNQIPHFKSSGSYFFSLLSIFLYCMTSMFYIFKSGLPQPSDILIGGAVAVGFMFYMAHKKTHISTLALVALLFGFYTFVINGIHYLFLPDPVFFKSAFYYIFNVAVMLFIISIFKKNAEGVSKAIYAGLSLAVFIQILFIHVFSNQMGNFFLSGETGRIVGTFNNPNQLALWSLLTACTIITLRSCSYLKFFDFCLLLILGYIQILSLSKAGLICYALLIVSLPFSGLVTQKIKIAYGVIFLFLTVFSLANIHALQEKISQIQSIERVAERVLSIGQEEDESFAGRNYTRIIDYPEFLLLGAGEGGYSRFKSGQYVNFELHSSLGTIIFSYGIIGMGLFICILFMILSGQRSYITVLVCIALLFGVAHQALRFTDFWVFLATAYGIRYVRKIEFLEREVSPKILSKDFSTSQ